jgi:hypothetical protein
MYLPLCLLCAQHTLGSGYAAEEAAANVAWDVLAEASRAFGRQQGATVSLTVSTTDDLAPRSATSASASAVYYDAAPVPGPVPDPASSPSWGPLVPTGSFAELTLDNRLLQQAAAVVKDTGDVIQWYPPAGAGDADPPLTRAIVPFTEIADVVISRDPCIDDETSGFPRRKCRQWSGADKTVTVWTIMAVAHAERAAAVAAAADASKDSDSADPPIDPLIVYLDGFTFNVRPHSSL